MNRQEVLLEAFAKVRHVMRLRPPQAAALDAIVKTLLRLPARLGDCSPEQRRQFLTFDDYRHSGHPGFTLALATGVGKSRLAGAIIATLWLANEADTFLILAPRRAVLRRLAAGFDPLFHDYIFTEESLVPEPVLIQADQMSSPTAVDIEGQLFDRGPRIYLLSQQFVTTSAAFRQRQELAQKSPADVLRERPDLVVIVDEAHHVGKMAEKETTAWAASIRDLGPALQIGLTATPRQEAGVNRLYDYSLREALAEGLYTKAVVLQVREFEDAETDPWRVDQQTISFTLERLALKERALAECAVPPFPRVKPTAVLFAKDVEHAKKVYDWLLTTLNLHADEVLLTYSSKNKTDDDLERLLSI
ncbi:hypothetical protein EG835_13065, partial [bacterium]|nr:hypothetical protein [bacterium]